MVRSRRYRGPKPFLRGSEFFRLVTMFVMLALLFLVMLEVRNASNWRWLTD